MRAYSGIQVPHGERVLFQGPRPGVARTTQPAMRWPTGLTKIGQMPVLPQGLYDRASVATSAVSTQAAQLIAQIPTLPLAVVIPVAIVCTTGILGLWALIDAKLRTEKPRQHLPVTSDADAAFHARVLARCPAVTQPYRPTPGLTNGHVETIFAAKFRRSPHVAYARECLRMADGGTVALDWPLLGPPSKHERTVGNSKYGLGTPLPELPEDAPVLVLLPGLTGGSGDSYVQFAVQRAAQRGIRAVVFNSRGTADSPVTTPQYYSASFTGDTRAVMAHVAARFPRAPLLAAGWSLGANILVRYLGEEGPDTPVRAAVSMCNPFELTISNANFSKGFNRIYDWNLAESLKRIFAKHETLWNGAQGSVRPAGARAAKTIREFDDAITIRTFGWPSVDAYYAGSSSALSVPKVAVPLLALQALDDPIAPKEAIPYDALAANGKCALVTTNYGGHLGWVAGDGAPFDHPWSDQAMLEWFDSVLIELRSDTTGSTGMPSTTDEGDLVLVGSTAVGAGTATAAVASATPAAAAAAAACDGGNGSGVTAVTSVTAVGSPYEMVASAVGGAAVGAAWDASEGTPTRSRPAASNSGSGGLLASAQRLFMGSTSGEGVGQQQQAVPATPESAAATCGSSEAGDATPARASSSGARRRTATPQSPEVMQATVQIDAVRFAF